ncbi:MAG: XRE family transcriptional regulator [Bryobacteraceae bacterium]|nr:XRE family transcriptional regulator [Bryobacteraceae bacterium]
MAEYRETSEETVRRVLSSYELGRKLRQLRLRKKIALVDLGKHTGLSASMLSQLENGKLIPTLPTLARIAMVFDVGIDHFFSDRKKRSLFSIIRAGERMRFPERADSPVPQFFFECLAFSAQDKSLQAYLAEFPRREPDEIVAHFHDGAEFLFVVEGQLAIRYGDEEHVLKAGDSVYFDSAEAHGYRGVGKGLAKALVVTTPPRL